MLTDIVNACLSTGSVADSLKRAIVKPLLKKPCLDPNESGLSPFVSTLGDSNWKFFQVGYPVDTYTHTDGGGGWGVGLYFLSCLQYTSNITISGMFFSRCTDHGTVQRQPFFVSLTMF